MDALSAAAAAASSTPLAGFVSGKPSFTPVSSNAGETSSNSTPLGGVIANSTKGSLGVHQPSRKLFELKVPPCGSGSKSARPALPTERYVLECEATTLALMPSGERAIVGCSDGSVFLFDINPTRQNTQGLLLGQLVPKGGLFTSLLLHIAIPADGTFAFVGAHRGTTEMVAWRLPCEEQSWWGKMIPKYAHSDAKLKGFGAATIVRSTYPRQSTSSNPPCYLLCCGRGIKNIHVWRFRPSDIPGQADWSCIFDRPTNGMTLRFAAFRQGSNGRELVSKSDGQNVRVWDLGEAICGLWDPKEKRKNTKTAGTIGQSDQADEDQAAGPTEKSTKGKKGKASKGNVYRDIQNTKDALAVCGDFALGGSNHLSVVRLDSDLDTSSPTSGYSHLQNRMEVALPQPGGGVGNSRSRSRRGGMRSLTSIAATADSAHVVLACSDGALLYYTPGTFSPPRLLAHFAPPAGSGAGQPTRTAISYLGPRNAIVISSILQIEGKSDGAGGAAGSSGETSGTGRKRFHDLPSSTEYTRTLKSSEEGGEGGGDAQRGSTGVGAKGKGVMVVCRYGDVPEEFATAIAQREQRAKVKQQVNERVRERERTTSATKSKAERKRKGGSGPASHSAGNDDGEALGVGGGVRPTLEAGDVVEARYADGPHFFKGTIVKRRSAKDVAADDASTHTHAGDGGAAGTDALHAYDILYEDGVTEEAVAESRIKLNGKILAHIGGVGKHNNNSSKGKARGKKSKKRHGGQQPTSPTSSVSSSSSPSPASPPKGPTSSKRLRPNQKPRKGQQEKDLHGSSANIAALTHAQSPARSGTTTTSTTSTTPSFASPALGLATLDASPARQTSAGRGGRMGSLLAAAGAGMAGTRSHCDEVEGAVGGVPMESAQEAAAAASQRAWYAQNDAVFASDSAAICIARAAEREAIAPGGVTLSVATIMRDLRLGL